jgi:alkaline phosphatase D
MFKIPTLLTIVLMVHADASGSSRQATGVKVGEVTQNSAIVLLRLTAQAERRADGIVRKGRPTAPLPPGISVDQLEGSCPGAPGRVRLSYGMRENLDDAATTDWVDVSAANDYSHQFRLTDLKPHTRYHYAAETTGPGGTPKHDPLRGSFRTAPPADLDADVAFTVVTGQAYRDMDHTDGFHIYEAMARLEPHFIVPTGDTVYYDSEDPRATTVALARYHWHRMYSFPRHVAFHLRVPGYWEKDDHDTLMDDSWPTKNARKMYPLTWEKGLRLFREQVPMGEKTYRTVRWGKRLQVWMVEGRDFRSSNQMPDGPAKTIWGAQQKRWLKETLLASDADFKVLISPTPIVGPDRPTKADNHSNSAFAHEGDEFRRWAQKNLPERFFIACGDRHWQYHSVHPETGVHEFSCGPASDEHAAGTPGDNMAYHRFHRVKGGFLSVSVFDEQGMSTIALRHHDVHGKVVNEYKRSRPAR